MNDYHDKKTFFYILLSVALHAGVLFVFFKDHNFSGHMGGMGGNTNNGAGDIEGASNFDRAEGFELVGDDIEDLNLNTSGPDTRSDTNTVFKQPNNSKNNNNAAIEIINIKQAKKPTPKARPVPSKVAKAKEKKIEQNPSNKPVNETKEKPANVEAKPKASNTEEPEDLLASENIAPEVIDLDPSDQDVMVIEETPKPSDNVAQKLAPTEVDENTHADTLKEDMVESNTGDLSYNEAKVEEDTNANNLIDTPVEAEKLNHIPIPKQLPKAEVQDDNQPSDLSNTENKSKLYDSNSNDNLLGLEGSPGNISNVAETNNNPQNKRGEFNIGSNNGLSGMANGNASGNTYGGNVPGGNIPGTGAPGGIPGEDIKIFRESEIIPLINAAPIDYPEESIKLREQGSVRMDLYFDKLGALIDSKITRSSGFKRLDDATRESVRNMRFRAMGFPFIYQTNFDFELEKN